MSRIDSKDYILDLDNNSEKEKIKRLSYPTIEESAAVSSVERNTQCPIKQDTNAQKSIKTVNTLYMRDLKWVN